MSCHTNDPSRRSFLLAGGAATAAMTFTACTAEPDQDVFAGGTMTPALPADELAVGHSVQLAVGANQVLLYREDEQTVHAFSAVCTHQGCIVGTPQDVGAPFQCPCHASNFDTVTGDAVAGPAQLPLTRHPAAIEAGWISVEVEQA